MGRNYKGRIILNGNGNQDIKFLEKSFKENNFWVEKGII